MRMTKETIVKNDGRLLTYYRFDRRAISRRQSGELLPRPFTGEGRGEGTLDPSSPGSLDPRA